MAQDLSDVYDAIRVAEKEGRADDVAALVKYLDTVAAAPVQETYDPRDQASLLYGAGAGAIAGAAGPALIKSGINAVQAGRVQPPSQVGVPHPSEIAPITSAVDEAASKGLANEVSQQVRTSQRAMRTDAATDAMKALKAKGLPVNPNILAEMPNQVARPSGILLPVETAKEIEIAEAAKKAAAPKAPLGQRVVSQFRNPTVGADLTRDIGNFAKGIYDYKLPFVGNVGSLLGRGLVGAGAGMQGVDAYNRGVVKGDIPGAVISGVGSLGTAATLLPHPAAKVIGTGVGLSAEAINAYRDAMREGRIEHGAPEHPENVTSLGDPYAAGGLVHLAEGGDVTKIPVEGDQFDKPNFEKVFSAVAKGYTAPHSDRHFEKGQTQPALNIGNPNYLLGTKAIKVYPQYQEYDKSGFYNGWDDPNSINISSSELNPYNLPSTVGHEAQHLQSNLAYENPDKLGFIDSMRRAAALKNTDELKSQIEKNYQDYLKQWKENQNNQQNNFGWGMKTRSQLGAYAGENPGSGERYADYAGLEAQLPRGQRLVDTELGKAVFKTPEQQAYLYQTLRPMEQKMIAQPDNKSDFWDALKKFKEEYAYNTGAGKSHADSLIKSGLSAIQGKAEGGDVKKPDANEAGAFVGYPQINKNRKIGSGTGFLDALVGAPPSRNNILNPSDYSYQEGYEKGEPYGIAAMAAPFAGAAAKPLAKALGPKAYEMLENYMVKTGGIQPITAWHGTPHNIQGNFDLAKVGTGEGAQVYSHGMYFAEKPGVARNYQKKLSDSELRLKGEPLENQYDTLRQKYGDVTGAILEYAHDNGINDAKNLIRNYTKYPENAKYFGDPVIDNASAIDLHKAKMALDEVEKHTLGNLYKVDIPDEHIPKMLDWDKPLSDQPHIWNALHPDVKNAIDDLMERNYMNYMSDSLDAYKGKDLYRALKHHEVGDVIPAELPNSSWLTDDTTYDKHASAYLNSLDVPGVKYFDQNSRQNIPGIRAVRQDNKTVYEVNPKWNAPNQKKTFDTKEEAQAHADSFGTRNFVSYRPEEVKILEKNGEPVGPLSTLDKEQ